MSEPDQSAWAELGGAWRANELDLSAPVPTAQVARRAAKFARTIRWRNAREIAGAVLLIVWGARDALHATTWLDRLPALALIAAAIFVAAMLLARGRNLVPPPVSATTTEFLAYERAQLERQHQLLSGVRRWYSMPLAVPVVLSFAVWFYKLARRGTHATALGVVLVSALVGVVAVFVVVDRLNARAAKQIGERLKALAE